MHMISLFRLILKVVINRRQELNREQMVRKLRHAERKRRMFPLPVEVLPPVVKGSNSPQ